jgi:hypothetical protein
VPKSQVTSAKLEAGLIRVGGPFVPDATEAGLDLEIVLVQGGSYAHGRTVPAGDWVVEAATVGAFDATKPAVGFGTLLSVDTGKAGAAIQLTFSWSETVDLTT